MRDKKIWELIKYEYECENNCESFVIGFKQKDLDLFEKAMCDYAYPDVKYIIFRSGNKDGSFKFIRKDGSTFTIPTTRIFDEDFSIFRHNMRKYLEEYNIPYGEDKNRYNGCKARYERIQELVNNIDNQ